MYTLFLEFPGLPKTTNANSHTHWSHQYKESKKWRSMVALQASMYRPLKPLTKASAIFTRYSSASPDFDGLVSSFKHLQDGLVDAQIIIDDTMKVLDSTYKWTKIKPKQGYVTIEIFSDEGGSSGSEEKTKQDQKIN